MYRATFLIVLSCIYASAGSAQPPPNAPLQPEPRAAEPAREPVPDLTTPQGTLQAFKRALQTGNVELAVRCVLGARPLPAIHDVLALIPRDKPLFMMLPLNHEENVTVNEQATVRQELRFRKHGGDWKIVPPAPIKDDTEIFNSLSGWATFVAYPEAMRPARDKARLQSCMSNLKQVALAILQMVQDYDEVVGLKRALEVIGRNGDANVRPSLMQVLQPYVQQEAVFVCPEHEGAIISYRFNEKLEGIPQDDIKNPAEVVLLYEGDGGKLEFRHGGKAVVAFVSGHVRVVGPDEAARLRWTP